MKSQVDDHKQEWDKRSVDFFRELKTREKAEKELCEVQEKPKPTYASIAAQTDPHYKTSQVRDDGKGKGKGKGKEVEVEMEERF